MIQSIINHLIDKSPWIIAAGAAAYVKITRASRRRSKRRRDVESHEEFVVNQQENAPEEQ